MREIKFRAWNKDIKRMCKIIYINFNEENIQVVFNWYRTLFPLEDFELMQYTNTKDKNEQEIYEGDILQVWTWYGIVKYFSWKYCIVDKNDIHLSELYNTWHILRVVWNIYENPELLTN